MPRTPRNGLASAGIGRAGSGLSAPASRVRTTSGRPSSARAIWRSVSTCSSSSGSCARSRKRNSVRSRPTPSAPSSHGAWPPRRRSRGWRRPPRARRRAWRPARARARARRHGGRRGARRAPARRRSSSSGVDQERPGLAVEQQRRALVDREQRVAQPDGGGQAERAGEDRGVRGGGAVGGGDPAHELGVEAPPPRRASARRRARCRAPSGPARSSPVTAATTRRPTSSTSAARSRSSGSSSAR